MLPEDSNCDFSINQADQQTHGDTKVAATTGRHRQGDPVRLLCAKTPKEGRNDSESVQSYVSFLAAILTRKGRHASPSTNQNAEFRLIGSASDL